MKIVGQSLAGLGVGISCVQIFDMTNGNWALAAGVALFGMGIIFMLSE